MKSANILHLKIEELLPLVNWKMFFYTWKIQGMYLENFPYSQKPEDIKNWKESLPEDLKQKGEEALDVYKKALEIISEIIEREIFDGRAAFVFLDAFSDDNNIYIGQKMFPMLRQQKEGSEYLSVADFIGSEGEGDKIGLFAVTAGRCWEQIKDSKVGEDDTYTELVAQAVADRVAEASAEWLNRKLGKGIRPAWGYPMLPDQKLILETKEFLPYEKLGITLTENGAMQPSSSISGLYINSSEAHYFMIGEIGDDQLQDYAERRGEKFETMKLLLRQS